MTNIKQNKTIIKSVWVTCLTTALIWLVTNMIFTPIDPGSGNTRLGFLIYGLFQLFTWGLIPLFLLALSIVVLDLFVFRDGNFSRRKLFYETCVLILGVIIFGVLGDEVVTGMMLCLGMMIGQV